MAAMSNRERIRCMAPEVRQVIHCAMTAYSLKHPGLPYDDYAAFALMEWDALMRDVRAIPGPEISDAEAAREVIIRLRKQPVWGKIFREGTS